MIVKDSGPKIEDMLRSWVPFIDEYTILDTGSTDGTPDRIGKVMGGVKGAVHERPFEEFQDFSFSRNRCCLELSPRNCHFQVMPDDSYLLRGGELLRQKLSHHLEQDHWCGFSLDIHTIQESNKWDQLVHPSVRLIRTGLEGAKWIYPVHETWETDRRFYSLSEGMDVYLLDKADPYHFRRSWTRAEFDLRLLHQEYQKVHHATTQKEKNYLSRIIYFVGETYFVKSRETREKDLRHAAEWFCRRVETEFLECGNTNDVYVSLTRLGRIAFKLNKPTEEAMSYLGRAIQHSPVRKEAYFYAANGLMDRQLSRLAFEFAHDGFRTPAPEGHGHVVDLGLAFRHLPEKLFLLSLSLQKFDVAETALTYMERQVPGEEPDFKRFRQVLQSSRGPSEIQASNESGKTVIAFVTQPVTTGPWNGATTNLRGSEDMMRRVAEHLARTTPHRIMVFCETPAERMINRVEYRILPNLWKFLRRNVVHHLVVSRFADLLFAAFPYSRNIRHLYVWVHDVVVAGGNHLMFDNSIFRKFICLTRWHLDFNISHSQISPSLFTVMPNSLPREIEAHPPGAKRPDSFIFSSDPSRGLETVFRVWEEIRKVKPAAVLHVFGSLEPGQNDFKTTTVLEEMREFARRHEDSVVVHGVSPKSVLYRVFAEAEYWFYPTEFEETFCITAVEAQFMRCKIIVHRIAGLRDVVPPSGVRALSRSEVWKLKTGELPRDLFDEAHFDLDACAANAHLYLSDAILPRWAKEIFRIKS